VANGNKIYSENKCVDLSWEIQRQEFITDLRLLKLGECDIVLGVDWMRIFNPIIFDFNKLEVTFEEGRKEGNSQWHCGDGSI